MGVVAISVTLMIFLNALITGLQRRLVNSVSGATAHIIVRQPERMPIAHWDVHQQASNTLNIGQTVKLEQRKRKIEDWPVWLPQLQNFDDHIVAVSPVVEGQGVLSRGAKKMAVTVSGVLPEIHNRVVDIESKLIKAVFLA